MIVELRMATRVAGEPSSVCVLETESVCSFDLALTEDDLRDGFAVPRFRGRANVHFDGAGIPYLRIRGNFALPNRPSWTASSAV